ncbi:MAG: MFS transporter [Gammaproteobacteria bacterium]
MKTNIIKQHKSHTGMLSVLMLTIMIDVMGFGLIFPLMPTLFLSTHGLIVGGASIVSRYWYYAIAVAMWPLGNFFGTAYLGELSDKYGRRRILIGCLAMVAASYLVAGVAIHLHTLWLFMITRLLAGFFGGSYDIAQAAIADISPPELKARNMSMITFAGSIGVVIGPLISSFTGSSDMIHWFSIATPFWIAGILSLINMLWIALVFVETFHINPHKHLHWSKVFTACKFVFVDPRVRKMGLIFFFFVVSWGFYLQQMPLVLEKIFNFNAQLIGLFFFVLGAGLALSMIFVQPQLLKLYSMQTAYKFTVLMVALILFLASVILKVKLEWISVFLIAVFFIVAYGCILALMSSAVTENEQGQVMGGLGAVGAVGFLVTGISLAILTRISVNLPIYCAVGTFFTSGILALFLM